MNERPKIEKHPSVNSLVGSLPQNLRDSFLAFEQRLECGGDLSEFIHTKPSSRQDALGNRTGIRHYHIRPCKPVCYLVYLVRFPDVIYILEVSEHPPQGDFASTEIEKRLYPRLFQVRPELAENELPAIYRWVLPIEKRDLYNRRELKGSASITPVRGINADYLPLGHLADIPAEQARVPIVASSLTVPHHDLPPSILECLDYEEHPDREDLTLLRTKWILRSGVYRRETEQLALFFCSLHHVVIPIDKSGPRFLKMLKGDYDHLLGNLRIRFPSAEENREEIERLVDDFISRFQLSRD